MSDYNTTKKCLDPKCGWANTYDKNDDWRHVGALDKCRVAGVPFFDKKDILGNGIQEWPR